MILVNGIEIKPTIFPDQTSQVWHIDQSLLDYHAEHVIEWRFQNEAEFIHLAQLKALLDSTSRNKSSLVMPYMPYGRQDKNISNETTFALKTFIDLVNFLEFEKVTIFDPHSKAANGLNDVEIITPIKEIYMTAGAVAADLFCYPDKGAADKYKPMFKMPSIEGDKAREQSTGRILSYGIKGDVKGKRVLIVDDICDGGGTFTLLADVLLKNGASEVFLYVSHGIFSKGIEVLKQSGISRIFTRKGEV